MEREERHHAFPIWLSFLLNSPIRRRFDKNPEKVVTLLGINERSAVLDFGCGPGFYAVPFAKVAKRVVAVDLQEKMLKKAAKYSEKKGVKDKIQFFRTDGKKIPQLQGGSCDYVFLSFVYHEIGEESKQRVLFELGRVLGVGGKLAILEYTRRPLIGPHSVNPESVRREVEQSNFVGVEVMQVSKNVGLIVATKGANGNVEPSPVSRVASPQLV